ncbi:MAG: hypothetical protein H6817_09685 [Phycisphaerales bacterium]|nr:hypothetical protein [Phycisphaerales bacterium]
MPATPVLPGKSSGHGSCLLGNRSEKGRTRMTGLPELISSFVLQIITLIFDTLLATLFNGTTL